MCVGSLFIFGIQKKSVLIIDKPNPAQERFDTDAINLILRIVSLWDKGEQLPI